MQSTDVYQLAGEQERLAVQTALFERYERPIYRRVLAQYPSPRILDVGCNNGAKTARHFANVPRAKVLGIEYHADLVQAAQAQYGSDAISFCQCDIERPDFAAALRKMMAAQGIDAFDVVHVSLVLMHLKHPARLLRALRSLLSPQGQLLVVEGDYSQCSITPDPTGLCQGFTTALAQDPFAGDATLGRRLGGVLAACGFGGVVFENKYIEGAPHDHAQKQILFDTFCSYLKDDADFVTQTQAAQGGTGGAAVGDWCDWVNVHYAALEQLVVKENTTVRMGLLIVRCCAAQPCSHSTGTGVHCTTEQEKGATR